MEPHAGGSRYVAQEGAYAAATSSEPVLHYMPARGRAEPIRLTLALLRQSWFEPPAAALMPILRRQLDSYPFRQLPRFVEEGRVDLVQSMAILRHLGRKHNLYGDGLEEAARVDMVIDAVSDLRACLKAVWCDAGLADDAVAAYLASVAAPEAQLLASNVRGPGLACLERLLAGPQREWPPACDEPPSAADDDAVAQGRGAPAGGGTDSSDAAAAAGADLDAADDGAAAGDSHRAEAERGSGGGDGDEDARVWLVGEALSIADIAVADLVDMHMAAPQLERHVTHTFPQLTLHRRRVMGQPGIREYLASNNRHSLIWGRDWTPPSAQD